jgi:glutamine phosphoribosylpyrophosphate amidotransferase
MKKLLGVDTFRYMGIEALKELVGTQFCDACFNRTVPFFGLKYYLMIESR